MNCILSEEKGGRYEMNYLNLDGGRYVLRDFFDKILYFYDENRFFVNIGRLVKKMDKIHN